MLLTASALAVVAITGLRALAEYGSTVGFALVGNRVVTEIRGDLYAHVQRLSLSFHNRARSGDLLLRVALLIAGAFYYEAPDWDIPISLIMASLAYLTAPWSLRVVVECRWRAFPAMLFATWFTVDGCYWLYWRYKNPVALELMRDANFLASLALYGMCGLVWYYRGTLRELVSDARAMALKKV